MENYEINDQELFSLYSDDAYKDYVRSIIKYPILPREEINRLVDLYQEGDLEARNRIIESNLRFVIFVAKRYARRLTHLEFLDVVNEGNLGLMRALESYDYNKGAFTTYAFEWIRNYVTRAIANYDDAIRKPVYIKQLIVKYYQIVNRAEMDGKVLSDEELCDELKINKMGLDSLRDTLATKTVSINTKVSNDYDEDGDELENFVTAVDDETDKVNDEIDYNTSIALARLELDELEYYVLYYKILYDKEVTLKYLATELGLTRERVRQIENKVLRKVKYLFSNSSKVYKKKQELKNIGKKVRVKPITPEQIIVYNYLSNCMSKEEQELLYIYYFSKYEVSMEYLSKIVGISESECKKMLDNLLTLVSRTKKTTNYLNYKDQMLKTYKSFLYRDRFIHKLEYVDYDSLKDTYSKMSYEELLELFKNNNIFVDDSTKQALKALYDNKEEVAIEQDELERRLNILLLNYYDKKSSLDIKLLRNTYVNNLDMFSDKEKMYLECFYFKIRPIEEFKYTFMERRLDTSIRKLEKVYYSINSLNTIDKNTYDSIRNMFADRFSEEELLLLDKYFNKVINMDKIDIDYLSKVIDKLNGIYLEEKWFIDVSKSKYNRYFVDYDSNSIAYKYFVEFKSINEIASMFNMPNKDVINKIKEEINNIDKKRFRVFTGLMVDQKRLLRVLNNNNKFTELNREIVVLRYINNLSTDEIMKRLNINSLSIQYALNLFYDLYLDSFLGDRIITGREILEEFKVSGDSILTQDEKEFVREFYSKTSSKMQVMEKLGIDDYQFEERLRIIKNKIKAKKFGIFASDTSIITRNVLVNALNDKHLPINEEEKEELKHLYKIDGYTFISLEEMAKAKNVSVDILRAEYLNLIVRINKYLCKEINGKCIYLDFKDYEKYYTEYERIVINLYYKEKQSISDIARYLIISEEEVKRLISNIEFRLYTLRSGKELFDYNYYEENINNNDLPYDGDISRDRRIFDLYFGTNSKRRKTIDELEKDTGEHVYSIITDLILSLYKYKDGYRKANKVHYGDVLNYYNKNKNKMSDAIRKMYKDYLNGSIEINSIIICDVIKSKHENYVTLDSFTKEDIIRIIKEKEEYMDEDTKNGLMTLYNIHSIELINEEIVKRMYKLLKRLDDKINSNNQTLGYNI